MQPPLTVTDATGASGTVEQPLPDDPKETVTIRLSSGRPVRVPRSLLRERPQGGLHLTQPFETFEAATASTVEETHVLPLAEEVLRVEKRTRETGRVRISTEVHEHSERVDVPLARESVDVQRIPIGRPVEGPVEIRQEGDTLIVPVLEERLVVRKQLVLVEELHVTRKRTEVRQPQEVTLRRETAQVERLGPAAASDPAGRTKPPRPDHP